MRQGGSGARDALKFSAEASPKQSQEVLGDSSRSIIAGTSFDTIRASYRPDPVVVLFVGESPPAGGTFFYNADSKLFHHTRNAFASVLGTAGSGREFLDLFKASGCYLDDLCWLPVNKLEGPKKRRAQREGIRPLAERLAEMRPREIVVVKKDIVRNVKEAIALSGLPAINPHALPFPSMSHEPEYEARLKSILGEFCARRLL